VLYLGRGTYESFLSHESVRAHDAQRVPSMSAGGDLPRWYAQERVRDLARALCLYLATRSALALFVWLTGQHYVCHGPRCLDRAFFPDNMLLNALFQWDAYQYARFAESGYYVGTDFDTTVPYFPAFPLAARYVGKLFGSWLWGGIVVNHLASIAGSFLATRLCRRLAIGESVATQELVARETTLFWLASPLSFFFAVYLSESLFAFASTLVIWSVVTGRWPLVLVGGIVATASRNAGLIVVLAAAILAFERRREIKVGVLGWTAIALMPLGLVGMMLYQHYALNDAFAWVDAQRRWNRFLTTPWRTIRDEWQGWPGLVLAARNVDQMYRAQELLALAVTAPLFFVRKRLNLPWALLVLGVLEWVLPLCSHSLISAARYQAGNLYFALAIPALLAPRPTLRGLCWMLFGMVMAWYASTYAFGNWAS